MDRLYAIAFSNPLARDRSPVTARPGMSGTRAATPPPERPALTQRSPLVSFLFRPRRAFSPTAFPGRLSGHPGGRPRQATVTVSLAFLRSGGRGRPPPHRTVRPGAGRLQQWTQLCSRLVLGHADLRRDAGQNEEHGPNLRTLPRPNLDAAIQHLYFFGTEVRALKGRSEL